MRAILYDGTAKPNAAASPPFPARAPRPGGIAARNQEETSRRNGAFVTWPWVPFLQSPAQDAEQVYSARLNTFPIPRPNRRGKIGAIAADARGQDTL
jgi:hypothetical protein